MATLEELDRRVTALEQAAQTEKHIISAVSNIVSESEKRLTGEMRQMRSEVSGAQADIVRLEDRIIATEGRFTDLLNDRFDRLMAAIDAKWNPPR
ncbi:MAG: hypothetical protein J2P50_15480 [Hyphomicrobiaceae bacterium]|nr:hypothetical protein [Hyphomicrobiaceae bacterium]